MQDLPDRYPYDPSPLIRLRGAVQFLRSQDFDNGNRVALLKKSFPVEALTYGSADLAHKNAHHDQDCHNVLDHGPGPGSAGSRSSRSASAAGTPMFDPPNCGRIAALTASTLPSRFSTGPPLPP